MSGKCSLKECGAPTVPCHEGCEDFNTCPNYKYGKNSSVAKQEIKKVTNNSNLNWSGEALSTNEIHLVSSRSNPFLIGTFGKADAGKTTYLAMVYTLLLNGGKLENYRFAGTKTILGWDQLHHRLRLSHGGVPFPPPTPVSANRLYHLALKDSEDSLKDLLFADASGEVFSLWGINRNDENAESARWIYANSNAFMLFIDCEALVLQKNGAKREIMYIARQLSHDIKNRPLIAVWSKADKKAEVLPAIKDTLKNELEGLFANFHEIEISNFLEPGPDELVHKNNLAAIDWLLQMMDSPSNVNLDLDDFPTDDQFLKFKGK